MSGPYKDQAVSLQRDTLSLPWGFRLQGGKDFKAPLTIQRVFVGSPADGVVHRGDVLVSIENHDTTNMFHKQAQDIIKQAGGSLRMRVRRGSSYEAARPAPPPAPSVTPQGYRGPGSLPTAGALAFVPKPRPPMPASSKVPSFGQDYTRANQYPKKAPAPNPGNMLSRVQKSLDAAIWQPGAYEDEPDYDYRPVHDLRNTFTEQPYQPAHGYTASLPRQQTAPSFVTPSQKPQQQPRGGGGRSQQPKQQYVVPRASFNNDDDEDYSQKSIRDLMGVFTERPDRREYPRRRVSLPSTWRNYHVPVNQLDEDEYEHVPVSELKKKFGKKQGKDGKPRRSRKDRPDQIDLPTEEDEDSRAGGMRTGKKWSPPDPSQFPGKPLYEPGWSPKQQQQQPQQLQQGGWSPVKPPTMHGLPAPRSPQRQPVQPAYVVPRVQEPDFPAWAGSLHSAGGVRPWEVAASRNAVTSNTMDVPQQQQQRRRSPQPQASPLPQASPQQQQQQQQPRTRSPRRRPQPEAVSPGSVQPHQPRVQAVNYAPGDVAPSYSQHGTDNYDGDAKIAHLQYNTPLGLYSRTNVEEALVGQTAGGAGEGTMQVTGGGPPGKKQFDPKQSSVLRLLQEQDGGPRPSQPQAPVDQSARYMEHAHGQEMQYGGYMDHYKQSPSMHALECNMGSMSMEEPSGTSDF